MWAATLAALLLHKAVILYCTHPTANGTAASVPQGDVLGIIMRRHDELCGLLVGELSKIKGNASTADAQLTVLANWVDDQVGLPSTDAQRPPPPPLHALGLEGTGGVCGSLAC